MFLIIFLWAPPHFWALSLNRSDEYARVGVPMLPVVAGRVATTRQILIYTALLFPISLLPWILGYAGLIYGAVAAVTGAILIGLALELSRSRRADRRVAHRLFVFSISYLFLLFAALLADHVGYPWSSMPSPGDRIGSKSAHAQRFLYAVPTACEPRGVNKIEV